MKLKYFTSLKEGGYKHDFYGSRHCEQKLTSHLLVIVQSEIWGFPRSGSGKEPTCQCKRQEMLVRSLGQEDPLEEGMATHSSILAGESHGQRSLPSYRASGFTEWDTAACTEWNRFYQVWPQDTKLKKESCKFYPVSPLSPPPSVIWRQWINFGPLGILP